VATNPSSATRSVLDASAVVRALVSFDESAEAWLRTRVAWPTLVYVEVAHTVLRLHRNRLAKLAESKRILQTLYAVDADVRPVEGLVPEAWHLALERSLTVYDACYVVLAEALDAPLVTADRRLAAATENAVFLN
jgi:predicted nucleic acid-binding protein